MNVRGMKLRDRRFHSRYYFLEVCSVLIVMDNCDFARHDLSRESYISHVHYGVLRPIKSQFIVRHPRDFSWEYLIYA